MYEVDLAMDDFISKFLNFLAVEKNASTNTLAAYRNDLSQFEAVLRELRPAFGRDTYGIVRQDDIIAFVATLRGRAYKDATVARKVAAVKSFFGFLAAEGLVP